MPAKRRARQFSGSALAVHFLIFLPLLIAFAQQHIGGPIAAVVALGAMKGEYRIDLAQPVIGAAFEQGRVVAQFALAVGNQGAADIMGDAVADEFEYRVTGLLDTQPVQIEAGIEA